MSACEQPPQDRFLHLRGFLRVFSFSHPSVFSPSPMACFKSISAIKCNKSSMAFSRTIWKAQICFRYRLCGSVPPLITRCNICRYYASRKAIRGRKDGSKNAGRRIEILHTVRYGAITSFPRIAAPNYGLNGGDIMQGVDAFPDGTFNVRSQSLRSTLDYDRKSKRR